MPNAIYIELASSSKSLVPFWQQIILSGAFYWMKGPACFSNSFLNSCVNILMKWDKKWPFFGNCFWDICPLDKSSGRGKLCDWEWIILHLLKRKTLTHPWDRIEINDMSNTFWLLKVSLYVLEKHKRSIIVSYAKHLEGHSAKLVNMN